MKAVLVSLGTLFLATAASAQSYFSTVADTEGKAISPTGIASYSEQGGPFLADDRCGLADSFGTFVLQDDPALLAGFDDRADCNGVSDTQEIVGNIHFTGPTEQLPVIYAPSTGAPSVLLPVAPSLPFGDRNNAVALDISANGLVVVGEDNVSSFSTQGVKWVGLSLTPSALAANSLVSTPNPLRMQVSPSGGFIAGDIGTDASGVVAFRETHSGGSVQQLTGSSIDVFSVNDDGTVFGDSGPDAAI